MGLSLFGGVSPTRQQTTEGVSNISFTTVSSSSPVAIAEFYKFAGILRAAL